MTKKPRENRIPIMMSDDELKAIDDWRFDNRVATRSEAVRRLCKIALVHQDLAPEINGSMKGLIDVVILAADELRQERPRSPEEVEELRSLASEAFRHCYALYDKIVEQTIRLDSLANGDTGLGEALDWEKRSAELLKGTSLFESIRKSPEAMEALTKAAERQRATRGRGNE